MIEELQSTLKDYIQVGQVLSYLAAFISGFILSFTPCIYPLIPVTLGYIGATDVSRRRAFMLSLAYVLGISATYAFLGLIASLGGKLFGQILINPVFPLIVGSLCIFLGLYSMDVIKINLPSFLSSSKTSIKKRQPNLFFSFVIGVTSGLVIGPCTAPVLSAILVIVAQRQNPFFGTSLLFVFALGLGTLLLLVGTFAGLIKTMPKAGPWMTIIKKLMGVLLILVGGYFIIKGIFLFAS
jgi:thiol:disulfide interchange protein DsbD